MSIQVPSSEVEIQERAVGAAHDVSHRDRQQHQNGQRLGDGIAGKQLPQLFDERGAADDGDRQQYAVGQLGQYKTDALRETLALISPYCDVTCDTIQVTEENLPDLLKTEDYICEAFDRAEAKAMLVSGVLEHFPEKYLVAGSGLAGLGSANTIQTRRVSQRFYLCGDGTSDSSVGLGLVASRVLVCAAHEANMILRLIAGETEP